MPRSTAMPPVGEWGLSTGRITALSICFTAAKLSPTVAPVAVMQPVFIRPAAMSLAETCATPPARSKSSTWWGPAGLRRQRLGVRALTRAIASKSMGTSASRAMASRCSTEFVLQPSAMSTVSAFSKACAVMMSLGLMSIASSSITFMPAFFAKRMRAAYTAGMVPLPGSAMPSASERQFMLLAVNMPEQEPQPGQASSSSAANSLSSFFPAAQAPTPSNTEFKSVEPRPESMGPPLMTMEGMLSRAAAISMPGTTLSQLGTSTMASKQCAMTMASMLSAMSSREASE